jgi:hypothetical protein
MMQINAQVGHRNSINHGAPSWKPLRRHVTRVLGRPAAGRSVEAQVKVSLCARGEAFVLELLDAGPRWARVKASFLLDVGQSVWLQAGDEPTRAEVTHADHINGLMTLTWPPVEG